MDAAAERTWTASFRRIGRVGLAAVAAPRRAVVAPHESTIVIQSMMNISRVIKCQHMALHTHARQARTCWSAAGEGGRGGAREETPKTRVNWKLRLLTMDSAEEIHEMLIRHRHVRVIKEGDIAIAGVAHPKRRRATS